MALKLWNPYTEFGTMVNEIGRLFDQPGPDAAEEQAPAFPPVNVSADAEHFFLEVLMPGAKPESVNVNVENGILTISSEWEARSKETETLRREHRWSRYERAFRLTDEIDTTAIHAEYHNGVLRLTLPKAKKSLPRKIEVALN